ncbi:Zinc-metallopeptidase [Nymphaea thermarum]|nr:Zinc-metallopeptidase [Nymphaea thermarum]
MAANVVEGEIGAVVPTHSRMEILKGWPVSLRNKRDTQLRTKYRCLVLILLWKVTNDLASGDNILGTIITSKFCPDTIYMILNDLTPNNLRIFWESNNFKGHTDMVESWYQTEFSVEKIIDAICNKPNIHFCKIVVQAGCLVLHSEGFCQDIDFSCPELRHSSDTEVVTDIFTRLLLDYLNDYAYNAQVTGLMYKISQSDFGFQLTVFGCNHKMKLLLDTIIEKVAQFEVTLEKFSVIKESMVNDYVNFKFRQPHQLAMYYFSCNSGPSEAETLVMDIEKLLFYSPEQICKTLLASQFSTNIIVKLQTARSHFYLVQCLNQDNENSALLFYVQVDPDVLVLHTKLQLFVLVAKCRKQICNRVEECTPT